MAYHYTIGIDEVGRGPIAGPVAVAAVALEGAHNAAELFEGIKDSKKLSEKRRQEWFQKIRGYKEKGILSYAVAFVDAATIDRGGIVPSIKAALAQSLHSLSLDPSDVHVLLDGGLKAPNDYQSQKTIIKGDTKEPLIAAAAILAKVCRDSRMCDYDTQFPGYGFAQHKGYGTKAHYEAIEKQGLCKIHRRSFIKNESRKQKAESREQEVEGRK